MRFTRRQRHSGWLVGLALLLSTGAAGADAPAFEGPVAPVRKAQDLEYRPVKGSYRYGSVLIEHSGSAAVTPKHRMSGSLRIDPVRDQLAVTIELDADRAGGKTAGPRTIRLLMTPKGELLDVVMSDGSGSSESHDRRLLLAEFAQELFHMFPRFPDHAVVSGDKLFDYDWDLGRMIGAPNGAFIARVSGTVRGTASHDGRAVLVVDYEMRGRCCGTVSLLEQGYELIDLATGVVSATAGHARMETGKGFSTWSSGATLTFQ